MSQHTNYPHGFKLATYYNTGMPGGTNTVNSYDEVDHTQCLPSLAEALNVARAESMDVTNDPRFFAGSVMNKRLAAFKSLTLVSSLMFGTALGQCFKLKKNMDFSHWVPMVGYIAYWQIGSFFLSVLVASMCLLSLYIISHQLFYCTRLTTAGPTGFEQATIFYTTRVIVVWRHLAVACLFNGLWMFIVAVGIQLFLTFIKDAEASVNKRKAIYVSNLVNGTTYAQPLISLPSPPKLDMALHTGIGFTILAFGVMFTCFLAAVRYQHLKVFQTNYAKAKLLSDPVEREVGVMSTRANGQFGYSTYRET